LVVWQSSGGDPLYQITGSFCNGTFISPMGWMKLLNSTICDTIYGLTGAACHMLKGYRVARDQADADTSE